MPDFFDPTPEQQIVVLVDAATLRKAERLDSADPTVIQLVIETARSASEIHNHLFVQSIQPEDGQTDLHPCL